MKKVWLDAGHGGEDPGAVGKVKEADMNLSVTLKVGAILLKNGVSVGYSRTKDAFIELGERCRKANAFKADLFVSIHHNAGGGVGAECIHSKWHGTSEVLAKNIMAQFKKIGQKAHGIGIYDKVGKDGKDYFAVIRDSNMPSIIAEFAYVDSVDSKKIDTEPERLLEATAIAKGILETLGIKYKI